MTLKFKGFIILFLLIASYSKKLNAQIQNPADLQNQYRAQQNQILAYNILSNGLMAGVGGVINKKPGEKFFPVFIKNFGKGCIGGAVKYTAKYQTNYLKNQQLTFFAPINRAYFFLGHSITMNASRNEKILSNYYCNFYGVNFHYNGSEERGSRLNAKLSLANMASLISFSASGHKLDFYRTLEYGMFYFDLNPNTMINGIQIAGLGGYNAIAIEKKNNRPSYNIIPHEIVHTFQHYDFFPISSFYQKPLKKLLDKSSLYTKVSKYIDFDYEPLFFRSLYYTQPKPTYYKNYFEFEAEHFNSRIFIQRN